MRSSRREFMRSGTMLFGALSAGGLSAMASAVGGADEHVPAQESSALEIYMVVYDHRMPDSAAFAERSRSLGLRTEDLDRGDVTALWYNDLYHRWKKSPVAIAGLTTYEALFVLEGFGNDAGLRRTFSAEHRIGGGSNRTQAFRSCRSGTASVTGAPRGAMERTDGAAGQSLSRIAPENPSKHARHRGYRIARTASGTDCFPGSWRRCGVRLNTPRNQTMTTLPAGVSAADFVGVLREFEAAVGKEWSVFLA